MLGKSLDKRYDAWYMLFGIFPCKSCMPKFWHTFVITYCNFMVTVEPWIMKAKFENNLVNLSIISCSWYITLWDPAQKGLCLSTFLREKKAEILRKSFSLLLSTNKTFSVIKQCAVVTKLNSFFQIYMITGTEMTNKWNMLEPPFCSPYCTKNY